MKKVLLLNPPGTKNYIRDYYCSKTSKAGYFYTPVDFIYISAYLNKKTELYFSDCIVEGISETALIDKISEIDPEIIITLTGFVSWKEDFALFRKIKRRFPGTRLIGSGDILIGSNIELLLQKSSLDAIFYDFSSSEIIDYCLDLKDEYRTIAYRKAGRVFPPLKDSFQRDKTIEIDIPPHELFPLSKYEYPFIKSKPFATVLTDFSCPYRCSFCIMSQLGYGYRSAESILKELDYLKQIGIKDIYFSDQTFGAHKKNVRQLLEEMSRREYRFGWVCFSRVDVIDGEVIQLMRKAGCHTIIFGIEFGNDDNLKVSQKNITRKKIIETIKLCRENKIRPVGTFLLGEPLQTVEDMKDLINFSLELDLDFASFNTYVPRVDDQFKDEASWEFAQCYDQSGGRIKSFSQHITDDELAFFYKMALKKFYFRATYLLKRAISIRTLVELKILIKEGLILLNLISKK